MGQVFNLPATKSVASTKVWTGRLKTCPTNGTRVAGFGTLWYKPRPLETFGQVSGGVGRPAPSTDSWRDRMNAPPFLAALHELFDVRAGTIHKDSVLQDIAGWSSMTFIGLIAMLDEDFGVRIAPGTILRCHTVEDLMDEVATELKPAKMAA